MFGQRPPHLPLATALRHPRHFPFVCRPTDNSQAYPWANRNLADASEPAAFSTFIYLDFLFFPPAVFKELWLSFSHLRENRGASAPPSPGAAASPPSPGPAGKCRGSAPAATGSSPGPRPPTGPGTGEGAASALPSAAGAPRGAGGRDERGSPRGPGGAPEPCPTAARRRPTGAGRGADRGSAVPPAGAGPSGRSLDPPPAHAAPPPPRPRRPRPALTARRCDPPALSGGGGPGAGGPCRGPAAATARLLRRRSEPLPPAVPPRPVSMCGAAALPSEHVPEPAHTRARRAGRGSGVDPRDPRPSRRWTPRTGEAPGGGEGAGVLWSLAREVCVRWWC